MRRIESRADIEVTYRFDDQLGMWLPVEMSEEYEGPIRRVRESIVGTTRTLAKYSGFKQFGTSVRIIPPK